MKVSDLQIKDKGLFYYLDLQKGIPFFEEYFSPDLLDKMFNLLHGEKEISKVGMRLLNNKVDDIGMTNLALLIKSLYSVKWTNTSEVLKQDLGLVSNEIVETETITKDDLGTNNTSTNKQNTNTKLSSAYDEVDFSNNEQVENKDIDTISQENENVGNSERVKTIKNNSNVIKDKLENIDYYSLEMYNIVFKDITRQITKLIY